MQDNTQPEISAGVVVMRLDPKKGPCVLTLRIGRRFDLPKGHVEEVHTRMGDPILAGAADELDQEADITLLPIGAPLDPATQVAALLSDVNFVCSNISSKTGAVKKNVYLYAAETQCPRAVIKPNPENGILEHDEVVWIPFGKVENSAIHPYLKPGVLWAMRIFQEARGV
jgi:hypothetical protein